LLSISSTSADIVTAVPTASAIAFVRVVTPRDLGETTDDMPSSEQQFVIKLAPGVAEACRVQEKERRAMGKR
jgi:hypothetical protein